jgi:hypothetical protein
MIQKRFNELQPYLKGVKLASQYSVVECILKNTWKIDGLIAEGVQYKSSGKESEEHKGYVGYMFWAEMAIDDLVDSMELIVNANIEMEQKQALLRSKVEELKKMFEDKPLEELKSLKFSSEMDVTHKPETPTKVVKEEESYKSNGITEKLQPNN